MRVSGFRFQASENRPQTLGEGLFHLGRFPDFGRGNPPMVAPVVDRQEGRQEGRPGGENPTRSRGFPSKRCMPVG
ncbi:hypothetical protein [Prochlorothrix hollandica]|uniref:hypothetical protein n=1 Tax=Prochlorothrix hollandica TaxID=1223 RepID=UPI001CEC4BDD|nr:hypothetical protein [Prochlorothrix hollandica]